MEKFNHLFIISGLLITLSCALPRINNPQITPSALDSSRNNTPGSLTESYISNSSSNNLAENTTDNTTPSTDDLHKATTPTVHNSTNSTTSNLESNSTETSPTSSQTKVTAVQITTSAKDSVPTSLATQPTSEPTPSLSTASTEISSPEVTVHGNESTSSPTATYLTTETTTGNKTNNETTGTGLNISEMSMTILFSVVLGVIVLIVLGQTVYKLSRNKHRSVQYTHRPLYNEDTGERFIVPEDTLVISGGLYDGPQIYNTTVTGLNDEEQPNFAYTPTQLRLEFLHEEQTTDRDYDGTGFETFKPTNEKP